VIGVEIVLNVTSVPCKSLKKVKMSFKKAFS